MKYFLGALTLIVFFSLAVPVFAVTITITNGPSTISTDSFDVNVTVDGANSGTNYLRIDLYKEGTTNYFGETFNGSSWYRDADGKQYFPITISSESTASATLQGRIGSPSGTEYSGPGTYKLRIRRYTESGNVASNDNQTPQNIQISAIFSSPTPTPVPTPSPTPSPEPSPTPSPNPQVKITPSPKIQKVSPLPVSQNNNPRASTDVGKVLAATGGLNVDPSPSGLVFSQASGNLTTPLAGMLLIGGGILFSGAAGFLCFLKIDQPKLV